MGAVFKCRHDNIQNVSQALFSLELLFFCHTHFLYFSSFQLLLIPFTVSSFDHKTSSSSLCVVVSMHYCSSLNLSSLVIDSSHFAVKVSNIILATETLLLFTEAKENASSSLVLASFSSLSAAFSPSLAVLSCSCQFFSFFASDSPSFSVDLLFPSPFYCHFFLLLSFPLHSFLFLQMFFISCMD